MTVHLCHQGRQLGEFSKEQVEAMLKAGVITDSTLAWTSGLVEWKALREVLGATTPPAVPSPQTIATTSFGQPPGHSNPTDNTPKNGLPSPSSAPPMIAMSPIVRQEVFKLAQLGFGQIIAWTLFILSIGVNGASVGSSRSEPNSITTGLTFVCGIFVFRSWCKRCTMRVILQRGVLRRIYWPALWSFGWRSICAGMVVALVLCEATDYTPQEKVTVSALIFTIWIFLSLFALDVPYWCRRRVERSICFHCGVAALGHAPPPPKSKTIAVLLAVFSGPWTWCYTFERDAWKLWVNLGLTGVTIGLSVFIIWIGVIYTVVAWVWAIIDVSIKPQDFYREFPYSSPSTQNITPNTLDRPVSVAPAQHSSFWLIESVTVAAFLVVGCAMWFWLAKKPANIVSPKGEIQTSQHLYNQGRPLPSNAVVAPAQPPSDFSGLESGRTPAADSNSKAPLGRIGDLFPSISQYGNPQYVINWKNVDPKADFDEPFEYVDYPATTGFIAPPSDFTVPIYSSGIGPVVTPVSPTVPVGQTHDSILYITDIRPGGCVVWVGRTNADGFSDNLCADYAVLAACTIAHENNYEYKYLEICEGGGWKHSPSTGGSLVYFPVLFYKDRPSTDARIQSVQEVESRSLKVTQVMVEFVNDYAAWKAKHSTNNSVSP